MKILVVCDQGNNRSVTVAHHLKYWRHDVLTAGISANTTETLAMLRDWADRIIVTDVGQVVAPITNSDKIQLWDIGPDVYPRPFNKDLLAIVRELMERHKGEYKP